MTPSDSLQTPVDRILEEQQRLTAVERFARWHVPDAAPAQEKYYKELIPLSRPRAGEQYSFEVDLDRCSGCQACVTACHSLNGLDDDESWREIGLLQSGNAHAPFQATVTTGCHHCVDPGCLTGCPVLAYDKDPVTGIVRHLDDQCIGCQYCVMKCPYEVPQYSAARGIVRKCDMCSSRLEHGEAPACVQACPSQAIRVTIVDQASLVAAYRASAPESFLPASPSPAHTVPTTRYVSAKPLPPGVVAGDQDRIEPAPAHTPLVFMLVFSQLAAGSAVGALLPGPRADFADAAAVAGVAAIALATLHLGKPLKAWRAFLGWRTSWFSREVIAFGSFIPLAAASAASERFQAPEALRLGLAWAAASVGLMGVACSAMIYADTHREFWSAKRSFGKFLGTAALLGLALALALTGRTSGRTASLTLLAAATGAVAFSKIAFEMRVFRHLDEESPAAPNSLGRTALLLKGPLGLVWRVRILCGVAGGAVLPAVAVLVRAAGIGNATGPAVGALGLCVCGELLERHLFFRAVSPDRMPGGRAA